MFGKRADGIRIKNIDAFYKIIPYIMKTRSDSQVFFEDKIYLENPELLEEQIGSENNKKIKEEVFVSIQ